MVVIDTDEEESVGWSGSASRRSVLGSKHIRQALRLSFGVANFH